MGPWGGVPNTPFKTLCAWVEICGDISLDTEMKNIPIDNH